MSTVHELAAAMAVTPAMVRRWAHIDMPTGSPPLALQWRHERRPRVSARVLPGEVKTRAETSPRSP